MISSFGLRVKHQALAQLPVGFGFGQRRQERRGAREEDGVAGFDDGAPERDREMRFADAGRAEDQDVFGLGEKARRSPARARGADRPTAGI